MIRSILRSLIFLLFSTVAIAQSTTVSATVVDSDSTAWANGTWSISFVPSQSFPNLSSYTCNGSALTTSYKGTLNGSGAFSQAMCTGSSTAPGGGSWNISICPNSSAPCGILNFTTAGSTLDLSSAITAVIPAPRFAAVAGAYGYADVEARLTISAGGTYWNVASSCQRYYNGSSWSCSSSPGIPSYAVDITQPPYNAKCDSVTDDHVAIQAALDNNAAIYIPILSTSGQTQCNLGSVGIQLCSSANLFLYNAIYGNGQIFSYSGTGIAIANPNFSCSTSLVRDLNIDMTGSTSTANSLQTAVEQVIGVTETGLPAGSVSVNDWSSSYIQNSSFSGGVNANDTTLISDAFGDASVIQSGIDVLIGGSYASQSSTAALAIPLGDGTNVFFGDPIINGMALALSLGQSGSSTLIVGGSLFIAGGTTQVEGAATSGSLDISSGESPSYSIFYNKVQSPINQLTNPYVTGTIPACGAATLLDRLPVSDATLATPGSTYVGSGHYTIAVQCIYNVNTTTYTWIID